MKVEQVTQTSYSIIYTLTDGSKVLESVSNQGSYDYMSKGGSHLSYNRNTKRINEMQRIVNKYKSVRI